MRARLALTVAGVELEHREVVLKDKPAHMLELSPKGTVPVLLRCDGVVLEESVDIMHWALRSNDPQQWLATDPATQTQMNAKVADFELRFKKDLDAYKYSPRQPDESQQEARIAARDRCVVVLQELEQQLQQSGFMFGASTSFVDVALMPFVRQFGFVEPPWFQSLPLPRLQAWLGEWLDSELFQRVMVKHPQWKAS